MTVKIHGPLVSVKTCLRIHSVMAYTLTQSCTLKHSSPANTDHHPHPHQNVRTFTYLCVISAADCTDHKSQGADTILCVDTSGSMEGQKFKQIKAFIESFIEGCLFSVYIVLVKCILGT